jgi:nicotinamidase-related amidase
MTERGASVDLPRPSPVSPAKDGRTALLIVDMQVNGTAADRGFDLALDRLQPGIADAYHKRIEESVLPAIRELLDYFRANGLPIVYLMSGSEHPDYRDLPETTRRWIVNLEERSGVGGLMWTGDPAFEIRNEIAPEAGEAVVRKLTFSPFLGTDLHERLRRMRIRNLIVMGVATCVCVESTARDAVDLGYGCVMVEEGQADYDERAHDAALRSFGANLGRVVGTVQEVIEAMEEGRSI